MHPAHAPFNRLCLYLSIAFANAVLQGMLHIHVLLDNPYADNCAQPPLRTQIVDLLKASRVMLSFTDQLPPAVASIFERHDAQTPAAEVPVQTATHSVQTATTSVRSESLV
jgi:hypothetical protein